MRRVCAWCGADLAGSDPSGDFQQPITHGICRSCSERLWAEVGGVPLEAFLESLEVPTLLVDEGGRVEKANATALGFLEKERARVEGLLGGEVFDCVNANLPGGCGKTVMCSACTVRGTVTATYLTDESQTRVPASLRVKVGGETREVRFLLTTEKVGDHVLVQVEPEE